MASLWAGAADDSYLYWMVDVDENGWEYDYQVRVKGMETSEPSEAGSVLNLYYNNGNPAGSSITKEYLHDSYQDPGAGFYAGFASNAGYKSYVIELLSVDNSDLLGSWSWTAAQVETYIAQNGIKAPLSAGPLTMSMALPAPEPSSGLLLLLGVAGLALRRRKQITA